MKKILTVAMVLAALALAGCPKKEAVNPTPPAPADCVIFIPACDPDQEVRCCDPNDADCLRCEEE